MAETKKLHVRKGDTVVVISGKDSGKVGKVEVALPKQGKVVVEGANVITRHTKPRGANQQGGRIEREAPIFASKVMLYCNKCKRPTRIAHKFMDDKTKVRVCKHCGDSLND